MSEVIINQKKQGTPVIFVYNSIPPSINEILNEAGTSPEGYDFETDDESAAEAGLGETDDESDAEAGLGETDDESDAEADAEEPKHWYRVEF
jgi:hypothetical protein